jgi:hypothetical protein
MRDWQASERWLGWDGRWYEGWPPREWWQSPDGRWHPPDDDAADDPVTVDEDLGDDEAGDGSRHDDAPMAYDATASGPNVLGDTPSFDPTAADDAPWMGSAVEGWGGEATWHEGGGSSRPPHRPSWQVSVVARRPRPPVHHGEDAVGWGWARDAYRAWPLWARIGVPALVVLLLAGIVGASVGLPDGGGTTTSGTGPTTTTMPVAVTATGLPAPSTSPMRGETTTTSTTSAPAEETATMTTELDPGRRPRRAATGSNRRIDRTSGRTEG